MTRRYYLDLFTLIQTLRWQSATLRTSLPKHVSGVVRLVEGKVIESTLSNQHGVIATGNKALERLKDCEEWEVQTEPEPAPPTQISPTPPVQAQNHFDKVIPYRTTSLEPSAFTAWTTKDRLLARTILTLINGKRSVQEIKTQLALSPELIEKVLYVLKDLSVIDW